MSLLKQNKTENYYTKFKLCLSNFLVYKNSHILRCSTYQKAVYRIMKSYVNGVLRSCLYQETV